ncbi:MULTISPECIES: polymorphic toxin type 33 domain-containing protein [unclassified Microcoleus]|uniref:polymorphic toxin type 33 domain-containing protein n=1 Tax=unclassified Microcoleus TaxID=2642155 RepID=UPI0025F6A0A1|nr:MULTISPECIES: polymorphic toxin type 33 domain-containing protein [unclassified Microcoleus]
MRLRGFKKGGEDIHLLKGKRHASKRDIYKDTEGNIYVKPKGGIGTGELTDLNINDF